MFICFVLIIASEKFLIIIILHNILSLVLDLFNGSGPRLTRPDPTLKSEGCGQSFLPLTRPAPQSEGTRLL